MMNNCQKCGNPLQPGTTSCPICGTIINNEPTNSMGNSNVVTPETSLNQNIVEQPMNVQNEQMQNMMQVQPNTAQPVNQIATEPVVQQPIVEASIPAQQPVEQVTNNPAVFGTSTTMQQQPVINQTFQTPAVEATTQTMNQPQVQTQEQVVQQNNITPETIQNVQPVAINNVQATPIQEQITQPIQEQVVQQVQPVAQPVNQPEQLNVPSQPTITEQVQQNTVIEPLTANTGIPSSLTPGTIHPINIPEQKTTKKFAINNKTLLIAGGVFVVLLVVIFVLTSNSLGKNNNQNQTPNENNTQTQTPPEENVLAITDTTINNYFLKIPDGWTASAYSGDVAVTNSNETAYALISSVSGELSQTNETIIKNNITQQEIENVVVESTTVDSKKAYKVSFVEEETYPAEIYYIDYDGTRIICVYTIYDTESDKEKYNEELIGIIETVIYSNKTQNAIDPNGIYFNKLMKMRGFPFLQAIEPEEPEQPETPDVE